MKNVPNVRFSTSPATAANTPHPVVGLYMPVRYRVPIAGERAARIDELDAKFAPHAIANGAPDAAVPKAAPRMQLR